MHLNYIYLKYYFLILDFIELYKWLSYNNHIFILQVDMLKKRAYLAPFLINIDIPPELLLEDDVNLLHTQFDVLQDHFKAVHKHLENIRKKDKDPALLKGSIQGLEVKKNHLSTKIQNLKTELQVSI